MRVATALGIRSEALIGPYQVHSAKAVIAHAPWEASDAPHADAIVTSTPNLALSVLTADCVPVLMADVSAGVVAAVHAGWKGAKAGVIESAIEAMESLGAHSARIAAAIGPAISLAAYEVGPEFKAAFVSGCEANDRYFSEVRPGHIHFNLPGYVQDKLTNLGIAHVRDVGVCTYGNESILFQLSAFLPSKGARLRAPTFSHRPSMMWITWQTTPDFSGFLQCRSQVCLPCLDGVCSGR